MLLTEDGRPVAELLGVHLARPQSRAGQRQFLHRPGWVRRALPPAVAATAVPRRLVLLDTGSRYAGRLTGAADLADLTATHLADPGALKGALDESVTDVCWVWQPQDGTMSAALLRAECERNYRELLALVAALDAVALRRPPRLWLVTEGAQALPGDEPGDGAHLGAATLWGFGRVLLTEYPQYRATLVDAAPGGDGFGALLDEWRAEVPGEYQIAHRADGRYVRRLLAGDTTPPWPGGYELPAPDSGDLSDLAPVPARNRAPSAGEVQVRVRAVALTAGDARTALDSERAGRDEPAPVLGSLALGTVTEAGEQADFAVGDEVLVRHDGALRATLTVPSAEVQRATGAEPEARYRLEETGEALRTAAAEPGTHVWVRLPTPSEPAPAGASDRLAQDRTYLVTGGLGGLGLVTARKLVELGARHLALVSRGGKPAEEAAAILTELSVRADVRILRADISNPDDVRRLADELAAAAYPVGGIVHAAGSYDKKLVSELTWESIDDQLAAKAYGGWLLHEAAQASFPELEFFVMYSSIASVLGGATQGHYAAASAALDSLADWRTRQGAPGLSVNWGAWARVGMSARLEERLSREIERSGVMFFSPTRALGTLSRLWGTPRTQRVVGDFDWDRYVAGSPTGDLFYDRLAHPDAAGGDGFDPATLAGLPKDERTALITKLVHEKVAAALHMDADDELDPRAEFVSLGLDSLMAMNVKSGLEQEFRLPLPASLTFDHPTVRQLSAFLEAQLSPAPAA